MKEKQNNQAQYVIVTSNEPDLELWVESLHLLIDDTVKDENDKRAA